MQVISSLRGPIRIVEGMPESSRYATFESKGLKGGQFCLPPSNPSVTVNHKELGRL
jgi:hypothetical protein